MAEGDELRSGTSLGLSADPAVARRMAPAVRLAVAGAVLAVLGVLAGVVGLVRFVALAGSAARSGWEVTLIVSAALMLVGCLAQLWWWHRAYASWRGGRPADLPVLSRASWLVHLASYAVVLTALLSGLGASGDAVWTTALAAWFTTSMVLVIAAQVLCGVQYVRTDGPPGTIPTHLRRLRAWLAEQRRFDDDDLHEG